VYESLEGACSPSDAIGACDMATMRIVLHGKQAQNPAVRAAVEAERAAGHQIDVRVTWEAGDAARLTEEACRLGIPGLPPEEGTGRSTRLPPGCSR
jgi:hypothetical protein